MKMRLSKIGSGLTLALAAAAVAWPTLGLAQGDPGKRDERIAAEAAPLSGQGNSLAGVWDVAVTIRNCETGDPLASLRAMNMFHRGGTLTEANTRTSPTLRTIGYGTWSKRSHHRYDSVFRFSRYNPDGTFALVQKVTRTITLAGNGDHFAAEATIEFFDANGNPVNTGCATETATRLD
jgi:hypothetical protein